MNVLQVNLLCSIITLSFLAVLAKIDFKTYKIKNSHLFVFLIFMLFVSFLKFKYYSENTDFLYNYIVEYIKINVSTYYILTKIVDVLFTFTILYIVYIGTFGKYIKIGGGDLKLITVLAFGFSIIDIFFIIGLSFLSVFLILTLVSFIDYKKVNYMLKNAPVAYFLFFGFLFFSIIDIIIKYINN